MALDILRFGLDLGTEANLVGLLAISLETNRYHELMRRKRKNLLALREILNYKPKPGGSKPGKASNKPRGREKGAEQIRLDYFVDEPALGPDAFQRSHRLSIPIYEELKLAIVDWESQNLDQKDRFFEQRRDCCGVLGYSEDQKMMAALFMMSYGIPSSAVEQYYRLSETVADMALAVFCQRIISVWSHRYLRNPTAEDVEKNSKENAERGFPVC